MDSACGGADGADIQVLDGRRAMFWLSVLFIVLECLSAGAKTVSLHFPPGTVLVRGPKALDFYDGFCANKATLLKADGKDVVDVKFIPKEEDEAAEAAG